MLRRVLHEHLGITLEGLRAMPWYVHDAIMEELYEEFGDEDGQSVNLGSDADLAAAGFNVREVQ